MINHCNQELHAGETCTSWISIALPTAIPRCDRKAVVRPWLIPDPSALGRSTRSCDRPTGFNRSAYHIFDPAPDRTARDRSFASLPAPPPNRPTGPPG
jgi:hypothetical protein